MKRFPLFLFALATLGTLAALIAPAPGHADGTTPALSPKCPADTATGAGSRRPMKPATSTA